MNEIRLDFIIIIIIIFFFFENEVGLDYECLVFVQKTCIKMGQMHFIILNWVMTTLIREKENGGGKSTKKDKCTQ